MRIELLDSAEEDLLNHLTSEPRTHNPEPILSFTSPNFLCILKPIFNLATKLVIPAAAERRAGIQKRPCDYWILAFG